MSIIKPHITELEAYQPPLEGRDPKRQLLLDFNERTLPVSPAIKEALISYIQSDRMQCYPTYGSITTHIAHYCETTPEQLIITNGSDHGIELIIRATCQKGDEAIIPGPSFAMYHQVARVEGLHIIEPRYTKTTGFPKEQVLDSISDNTRIIIIANPNNPSGTAVSRHDIIDIATRAPNVALLIDECYFEYTGNTVADLAEHYPNVLITRTFSKTWGLPSVRLGYIISHSDNIKALLNVRGPYDINQLAVIAIEAALKNPQYTQDYIQEVMTESKPLFESFLQAQRIDYWPSVANFIWIFPEHAEAIDQHLKDHSILVRPKADDNGRLGLRVNLGNKDQTQRLIDCMRSFNK